MASKMFVGIDIGSQHTKVVVLEKNINVTLARAVSFPSSFVNSIKDGVIVNQQVFSQEIAKIIPQSALASATVCLSILPSSITTLVVVLPLLSPKELAFIAVNEARNKMIPMTVPEHVFRCSILGQRAAGGANKSEVQVIRTEQAIVRKLIDLMGAMSILPAFIMPASFSIASLASQDKWNKEEDIAFIDIGASTLTISICREKRLVFTRTITFGCNDIVTDLTERLGVPEDKIRSVLSNTGVPQVDFNLSDKVALAEEIMRQKYEAGDAAQNGVNMLELRMHLQPHSDRIVQEIRRSLAYNKERWGSRRVDHMYFLGGGSQIKNLVATLAGAIGGQCEVIKPFTNGALSVSPDAGISDDDMPVFANAAGMALQIAAGRLNRKDIVNFLPPELARKKTGNLIGWILSIGDILMVAGFIAAAIVHMFLNAQLTRNIENLKLSVAQIEKKQDVYEQYDKNAQMVSRRKQNVSQLAGVRPELPDILIKLPRSMAGSMYFQKVELTTRNLSIQGFVAADYERAGELLGAFREKLAASGSFANVLLKYANLEKISFEELPHTGSDGLTAVKNRSFELTAQVK